MEREPDLRTARISRFAAEMGKLFTPGHNVEQTPEYEAWRHKYLQAQVDYVHQDEPEGTHSHLITG